MMIEWIGALAATLSTGAFLPQAMRTIRTRQTRDLSIWTQLMLFFGTIVWLTYGVFITSWPLIIANAITMALVGIVLVLKIRHG